MTQSCIDCGAVARSKRCEDCREEVRQSEGPSAGWRRAPELRRCACCDSPFTTVRSRQRCCSEECRSALQDVRHGRPCSARCGRFVRGKAAEPTCLTCRAAGNGTSAPVDGQICCSTCRAPIRREPKEIARSLRKSKSGRVYCSKKCANAEPKGRSAPRLDRASRRAADRARCARRRGALALAIVEIVDPDVVLERDGWRCHVCGKRIDRTLSGRAAMGPTIDHLVPISEGGEHSYANVRAAHRRCNSRRGVGGAVQLALVG